MKLLSICVVILAASARCAEVGLLWDANDPAEQVERYYVYQATNVLAGFLQVTNTVTNSVRVQIATNGQYFFFVTASNFWGESFPSNTNASPKLVLKPANVKIQK